MNCDLILGNQQRNVFEKRDADVEKGIFYNLIAYSYYNFLCLSVCVTMLLIFRESPGAFKSAASLNGTN